MTDMKHNNDSLNERLRQQRLRPLDVHFARFVAAGSDEPADGVLAHSAALLSWRAGQGDVCVDLDAVDEDERSGPLAGLTLEQWQRQLAAARWVADAGQRAPLVLHGRRLYLHKFWRHEQTVAEGLLARLALDETVDSGRLRDGLGRLFEPTQPDPFESDQPAQPGLNWQRLAATMAVLRRLAVISGGPGTGKTTTVVKVLALLLEQQPELRIALAAPTGKAAARLSESVRNGVAGLAGKVDAALLGRLPTSASTIHRLLQAGHGGFRHNRANPLLVDCLLLDEASMIDLPLMASLLQALPPQTRVILLGDRDQLASVEAGSVLSDITGRGVDLRYDADFADHLATVGAAEREHIPVAAGVTPPIANAIALLRVTYRFGAHSGIGALAGQVKRRQGQQALQTLRDGSYQDLGWIDADGAAVASPHCIDWAVQRYAEHFEQPNVQQAMQCFEQARVLCAMRRGPFGVTALNERITEALARRGLVKARGDSGHYRGRPILITRNDYASGLFNGDIGLVWPDEQGEERAWFAGAGSEAGSELRAISLHRLPEHETAWCLSVHKSQGSEFEQVLLLLPAEDNAVLSREMLYTGITRAKAELTVHASEESLLQACETATRRSSGLAALLGWEGEMMNFE